LNELLAGSVVVPFAVALDDGDQMVERILTAALAVERHRQIEAGLMVERLAATFCSSSVTGPTVLAWFGEFERGARGGHRGVVALGFRHHGERLPRLIERAGRDVRARQAGKRRHIGAVLGEKLRINLSRSRGVALGERGVGFFQQILASPPMRSLVSRSRKAVTWPSGNAP